MDSFQDSTNYIDVADFFSPSRSDAVLQQEYNPSITIEDSDDDMATSSPMPEPGQEVIAAADSSAAADVTQHAGVGEGLALGSLFLVGGAVSTLAQVLPVQPVVEDGGDNQAQVDTSVDMSILACAPEVLGDTDMANEAEDFGKLDAAIAAVASMLGSVEQTSKPIMQSHCEDGEQQAATAPTTAWDEQTSQTIADDVVLDVVLDEQPPQTIVDNAMPAIASDEQTSRTIPVDAIHDSRQRHATVLKSTSGEQSAQAIAQDVLTACLATVEHAQGLPVHPVIQDGDDDQAHVEIRADMSISACHACAWCLAGLTCPSQVLGNPDMTHEADEAVQIDPILSPDEQMSQANMEKNPKGSQGYSRGWFSFLPCSRRARQDTKRKLEKDESKDLVAPETKRYRQ